MEAEMLVNRELGEASPPIARGHAHRSGATVRAAFSNATASTAWPLPGGG